MKKILFISAMFLMAMTTKLMAQRDSDGMVDAADYVIWRKTFAIGTQTEPIPGGKGSVKFTRQGDKFNNVIFTDAAGKTHRLLPAKPGTNGAPKPGCAYPLPDACFATADKNIGMCMCKPGDLSNGETYEVTARIPPVVSSKLLGPIQQ